ALASKRGEFLRDPVGAAEQGPKWPLVHFVSLQSKSDFWAKLISFPGGDLISAYPGLMDVGAREWKALQISI
ncbi:unnamed protein product, partial [Prorocentrum cordatum]